MKHFTRISLLLATALMLPGCFLDFFSKTPQTHNRDTQTEIAQEKVKVGVLVPMSGRHANIGQAMFNAAQQALFSNPNSRIELLIGNTQGHPEGASLAAQNVVNKGASIIVGPLFSSSTTAASRIAAPKGIPIISFSNDKSVQNRMTYTMGIEPGTQIRRIMQLARDRGYKRTAVVIPDNEYGAVIRRHISSQPSGSYKVFVYETGAFNFKQMAESIQTAQCTAVLIPEGGRQLGAIVSSLSEHGIHNRSVKFLGSSLWDVPTTMSNPKLFGAWFATTPSDQRGKFYAAYKSTFGNVPPQIASLGYDVISSIISIVRKRSNPNRLTINDLSESGKFNGITGQFSYASNGLVSRDLIVVELTSSGPKVIEQSGKGFDFFGMFE